MVHRIRNLIAYFIPLTNKTGKFKTEYQSSK